MNDHREQVEQPEVDDLIRHDDAPATHVEPQILHRATFEAQGDPLPPDRSPQDPGEVGDPVERLTAALLDRIAEGLQADVQKETERLTLARTYGQRVLELKRTVPHGGYMDKLRERFTRSSYHKCHRWRFIAERDEEVEAALREHPDVTWGPTKVIAYLKGRWSPGVEAGRNDAGDTGDHDGESPESTAERPAGEVADESLQVDAAHEGEEADPDGGQERQAVAKTGGGTPVSEKKYEKLMDRFQKGGDMNTGGRPAKKTSGPTGYRLTVVTPEKGDLDKFGALLPSPVIDFKARSVSAWVRAKDIVSTVASVVSTLTASSLKKVRIVVEL